MLVMRTRWVRLVKKSRLLASIAIVTLMLIGSFSAIESITPLTPAEHPQRASTMALLVHANITIVGNDGFLGPNASTGISWGNGTDSNPYIIENWEIRYSLTQGIHIFNTGMHLIIRNCYIHDNGQCGILLGGANNVDVVNCTVNSNDVGGMYLDGSEGNILSNNSFFDNRQENVRLLGTHGTIISGNNFSKADWSGLNVTDGYGHDIFSNSFHINNRNGIVISGSEGDSLTNNSFIGNAKAGIMLISTDNCTIAGNNCSNSIAGIWISDSSTDNDLSNNSCLNDDVGIRIHQSNGNSISDNRCHNCSTDGVYVFNSAWEVISDNDLSHNGYGMRIESSSNNMLSGNNCSDGLCGLYFDGSTNANNTLFGNFFSNNSGHGIWCHNVISMIHDNTFSNNSGYGIYSPAGTYGNCIWNNTFCNNNGASGTYSASHIQAYDDGTNDWNSTSGYGNFWIDWMAPDDIAPWGVVDSPYVLSGAGLTNDYFPRTVFCGVTSPTVHSTYYTDSTTIDLGGTALGMGITVVNWENTVTGDSGTATGVTSWSVADIPIGEGNNLISIVVWDALGYSCTYNITVIRDTVGPACTIISPTTGYAYETAEPTVDIGGTASDNIGLAGVTWRNVATGESGTAAGTTAWTIGGIALVNGTNLIYVNSTDNVGHVASAMVTVIYTPIAALTVAGMVTPAFGATPLLVLFDCFPSGGGSPFTYLWDFGDGTNSTERDPSHFFNVSGTYDVTLTVTDNASQTATWNTTVTVSAGGGGGIDLFNLVFVLLIIGLIVAIAIPSIFGMRRKAKEADSRAGIKDIGTSVAQMKDDVTADPTNGKPADNSKFGVSGSDDGPKKPKK